MLTLSTSEPAEYAPIEDSYNPIIHRLNQVIRDRALNPNGPIPPIPPVLVRYAAPPDELVAKAQREIDALIEAAEVKKGMLHTLSRGFFFPFSFFPCCVSLQLVRLIRPSRLTSQNETVPPKAKSKRKRETAKPLSGLDVDALLSAQPKRPRLVTRENAIPEFKQTLASAMDMDRIREASDQMGEVICGLVTDSFGDSMYERAIEAMGVMRTELIELDEPDIYNSFLRDFKTRLLAGELGGDRREIWWKVRTSQLGLVDQSQSELSKVTSEEAQEVCGIPLPCRFCRIYLASPTPFLPRPSFYYVVFLA